MQERYLGDSHDFMKYALLRTLNKELGLSLGINWYLTDPNKVDPIGNNDGEKRHHLKGGVWKSWDADLFEKIEVLQNPKFRSLDNVSKFDILPKNTIYYTQEVPSVDRAEWHRIGLHKLKHQDVVFLDPDNGFQVKSMTTKRAPKYTLYSEFADYFRQGQSVLAIQFARQCNPIERAKNTVMLIRKNLNEPCEISILRGRLAPNLLFIMISQSGSLVKMNNVLKTFCNRSGGKSEMVPNLKMKVII